MRERAFTRSWYEISMIKHFSTIILISVASVLAPPGRSLPGEDRDFSIVTVESPSPQAKARLLERWQNLPRDLRERVAGEIFAGRRLGLSSTGSVQLIGVYTQPTGSGDHGKPKRLFHLRQTDLMGQRLFWSILLDPEGEAFKILYHISPGKDPSWLKLGGG